MSYTEDFYFKKAKAQGLRARSYFKLEEIDKKFQLIKAGIKVLDLGAAPGSWCQYMIHRTKGHIHLTAADLTPIEPLHASTWTTIAKDIYEVPVDAYGGPFDGIVSDMAPATMGIHQVDSAASAGLVEKALQIASETAKPRAFFVAKYLQGSDFQDLQKMIKEIFPKVKVFKPESSRKHSTEIFFIALREII